MTTRRPLVLIACEESQVVYRAFRSRGIEAYSCDLQPCSGGHPNWHLHGDALLIAQSAWDLIIAHPPCTYISRAGARWMYPIAKGPEDPERLAKCLEAREFFMSLLSLPCPRIAVENPIPLRVAHLPRHSQKIQPYEFGEPFSKATLLWLRGLPKLKPTAVLSEYRPYLPSNTGGAKRGQKAVIDGVMGQRARSKTFQGIASAMATQWGSTL